MLADRHDRALREETVRLAGGWTARQYAEEQLLNSLNAAQAIPDLTAEQRFADLDVFRQYAYQWY